MGEHLTSSSVVQQIWGLLMCVPHTFAEWRKCPPLHTSFISCFRAILENRRKGGHHRGIND